MHEAVMLSSFLGTMLDDIKRLRGAIKKSGIWLRVLSHFLPHPYIILFLPHLSGEGFFV